MSHLTKKSAILIEAAELLHKNGLYPAVAHGAYYSCYQLMMHIWLYSMRKTERELKRLRASHEFLIGSVGEFMLKSKEADSIAHFHVFYTRIWALKKLRTNADYSDTSFDKDNSDTSLSLSLDIIPILKKY
jgi:uncharacterized protein (UPF0332 family)